MFISHLHEQHNSSLRIIPFALLLGKKKTTNQPTKKTNKQTNKKKPLLSVEIPQIPKRNFTVIKHLLISP